MIIFLCIVTVFTAIFIGLVLFKGYTLMKDYKKGIEDLTCFHSKIKELEDVITQPVQNNSVDNHNNNSIPNQKYDLLAPKVISDNKVYSQEEFSREINSGKFQMSPMLQSKLYEKK